MNIASAPSKSSAAFIALFIGAVAIGASPIFVRLADVGPFASAFWRVALALPLLAVWMAWERGKGTKSAPLGLWLTWKPFLPAGLFFAGDMIFWHLSIQNTTVTNATLFANFSPVVVTIGAWLVLKEPITRTFAVGLGLAMTGSLLLVGSSYESNPAYVTGDVYGMITAFFFGSYLLSVRAVRDRVGAAELMFRAGCITAAILFVVAFVFEDRLLPLGTEGWIVLLALAWVSHVGGQGMLAFALGHVSATVSSLVILIEPLAAAILGWLVLTEAVTPLQAAGGVVILAGIYVARRKSNAPADDVA